MKTLFKLMLVALALFSCSNEQADEFLTADAKLNVQRLPKKTNIILRPTAVNSNPIGNIMQPLAPLPDGIELPADNNGGLVDWDGDGQIDDLVTQEQSCNAPYRQSIFYVYLNGTDKHAINYTSGKATILGFADVNGDGTMDIITEWGRPTNYNAEVDIYGNYTVIDGNYQFGTLSQYNVGYNVIGRYPLSTAEILSSMEVSEVEKGQPNNLVWDLSDYGYEDYTFYVDFWEGNDIGDGKYYGQTWTYGYWGFYFDDRLTKGQTYTISFRYMDNCERLDVSFVNN